MKSGQNGARKKQCHVAQNVTTKKQGYIGDFYLRGRPNMPAGASAQSHGSSLSPNLKTPDATKDKLVFG